MQRVRCYDCGKLYNYDEDCFCPKCGAFNQPQRSMRIGADGSVVRVDGINEANHTDSFVHRELHEEKRERRRIGLDKAFSESNVPRRPKCRPHAARRWLPISRTAQGISANSRAAVSFGVVVGVIILIVLFNLLSRVFLFFD